MVENVERAREEPVRERIRDEEVRDVEDAQVARALDAVALQGAEVVGVAELGPQLLEDRPVVGAAVGADLGVEVPAQVLGDPIVVEQRVVDVEEEDDVHPVRSRQAASTGGEQCERKLFRQPAARRVEPGELRDVVGRPQVSADGPCRPEEVERGGRTGAVAVPVHPDAEKGDRLDLEPGLLEQLPSEPVERMLVLFEVAAGCVPVALVRLDRAPTEQQTSSVVLDERARTRNRVRPADEATGRAAHAPPAGLEIMRAAGAVAPAVEDRHRAATVPG